VENNEASALGPRSGKRPEVQGLSRSRAMLLDMLRAQSEPTGLAALVASSGLHENTVRAHLDGLEKAGLISRERATPDGRGRPAWLWSAVEQEPAPEYAGLAGALAATLHRTSADPVGDAVTAGTEWGRQLAREHGRSEAANPLGNRREIVNLMDQLGFEPETGARAERVRLTRCPLLEVAKQHTEIVCNVHTGLVRGALSEYGDDRTEVELVPFAEPGACVLRLRSGKP
jgi:predicted ArsR family transcriptional regulator